MGTTLSFVRVSTEELQRVQAADDPHLALHELGVYARTDEPSGYLDKAWGGLGFLMLQSSSGIELLSRDRPILEDRPGTSLGLYAWPAEQVADTAAELRETPFETLQSVYDPGLMTRCGVYPKTIWETDPKALDYLRYHYQSLTQFFDYAASRNSAAIRNMT
ncbi:DUF1877 family protein [Nocardia tengchongensis]